MTMAKTIDENEPWFRNPWVWLLIAIPALTVAGCLLTIYLAITNPDMLVSDAPPAHTAGSTDIGRK